MNNRRIYFDINIIVDLLDTTRSGSIKSQELVKKLMLEKAEIVISEDMLSTVFYLIKNKQATLQFFKTIQARWHIVSFGAEVIKNAIEVSLEKNLDLEDVLQCLCAKENGCSVLITNDKNFYDCGILICSTEEFLVKDVIQI